MPSKKVVKNLRSNNREVYRVMMCSIGPIIEKVAKN